VIRLQSSNLFDIYATMPVQLEPRSSPSIEVLDDSQLLQIAAAAATRSHERET